MKTDAMFEIGKVPLFPHVQIIEREYRPKEAKWYYGIINNYNSYGSGWADEDWFINQITKLQQEQAARIATDEQSVATAEPSPTQSR